MDKILYDALASSGIVFPDDAEAAAAGFSEFTSDDVLNYGFRTFGHGLLIKYPQWDGSIPKTGFARIRYTTPLESFKTKRPIRYLQPADTTPKLYLPNCGFNWLDVAGDVTKAIIITEGEKKAYAAQLFLNMPTIGLGGVSSFSIRKVDSQALLDDFQVINFKARVVYIAFDSDIAENMNVERAELVLAEALTNLGAEVFFVRLPSYESDKQGLDDCIVNMGAAATQQYIDTAEPYVNAKALASFGKNCWYIRKLGAYIDLTTNTVLDTKVAIGSYYSNHTYLKRDLDKKGQVCVVKSNLFKDYNTWPARNEFTDLVSEPGQPRVTADGAYNLWTDTSITPLEGSVSEYLEFCKYFFADDPQMETWWHNWVACMVQNQGIKMQTAWLLYSHQTGTGKSLMARLIGRMFGKAFIEGHSELLTDERNDWAIGRQVALIDDLNEHVNRKDGARIRALVTRMSIHVNPKFKAPYDVNDHVNFIITTNEEVSVKIENTDRRFFVVNAPEERADDELYTVMHKFLFSDERIGNLRYFYDHYELPPNFNYATRPSTDTKALQMAKELSEPDQVAFAKWVVHPQGIVPETISIMSSRDLLELYNVNQPHATRQVSTYKAMRLSRELTRMGYRCLSYSGGVDVGYKATLFWVGPHADKMINSSHTPASLRALYDSQTVHRVNLLAGLTSSKF